MEDLECSYNNDACQKLFIMCFLPKLFSFKKEKLSPPFISLLNVLILPGDHSEEVPPVPIPNTEVKLFCADGTAFVVGE